MVLKGNINLAMNVLTTTLSLLFGGGFALLNFLLQMVSIYGVGTESVLQEY